jgi:GMP synthase-like glutamine amidotransferase
MFLQKNHDMLSRVDIIQNDQDVPAGVLGELLAEWQVPFAILRADLGETCPAASGAGIVLGGAMGVHDEAKHPFLRQVKGYMRRMLAEGQPLFGICLGGQLLAEVAGGVVRSNCRGEKGLVEITLTAAGGSDPLFAAVNRSFRAFQWHNDSFMVPSSAAHLAGSDLCPDQAFRIGNTWGIQFHPEVDGAIVADWSRRAPNRERLTADFAAAEQTHRALARQLLINFLKLAGIFG